MDEAQSERRKPAAGVVLIGKVYTLYVLARRLAGIGTVAFLALTLLKWLGRGASSV